MEQIAIIYITTQICTQGYLPLSQINALTELHDSLNGNKWTKCQWNITQLAMNKTLPPYYCGLSIDYTSYNTQTVSYIAFHSDNNLNGTISNSINKLTDLQGIDIYSNELLIGNIPSTICNLTQFWAIDLSSVSLSGDIPRCIGHMFSLQWFSFVNIPLLSIHDDIIKQLCFSAKNLSYLTLDTINYTGSIPECMGEKLLQLFVINFTRLRNLYSTIPESFSNFTKLTMLEFGELPNLYGSMPSGIFKHNHDLSYITILNTSLNGIVISEHLCQSVNLNLLIIRVNPLVTGSIPECFTHSLKNLIILRLDSNSFIGKFPSILSPQLKVLDIHNNRFFGSISSIFGLRNYPFLEIVALHQNNFVDHNIGTTLKKILANSTNIKGITIYDNHFIGGTFPSFDSDVYLNNLSVFAAHQLNIGGFIPNNFHLGANAPKSILSVYDNQLSGTIPLNLFTDLSNNITSIILRGNLFTIRNPNNAPDWIKNSDFIHATQMYITLYDVLRNWGVLIIGFLCFLLVLAKKKSRFVLDSKTDFIKDMKKIDLYLNDNRLMFLILVLLIFYPFSCSYYSFLPILSYFSLFFFYNQNTFINITLGAVIVVYNIVVISITTKIITNIFDVDINNTSVEMQNLQEPMIQKTTKNNEANSKQSFFNNLFTFGFYFSLYVLSIMVLIIYIVTESLPDENILSINDVTRNIVSHSVQLVLAVNTALIIPRFIDSAFILFKCKNTSINKTKFIMVTRTLTTIIIPVILSVILLNECGGAWAKLWRPCVKERKKFNIQYELQVSKSTIYTLWAPNQPLSLAIHFLPIPLDVLSSSAVCSVTTFQRIRWNKCIRLFLYHWCNLLMVKMIIMFFMPLCILLWKTLQSKVCNDEKRKTIKIDSEYSMVVTKLEIIFSFGIFCPLLFPIVIISLNSFIYFYHTAINRLQWQIKFSSYENGLKSFPFYFLWIGILIQQIITFLFFQTDNSVVRVENRIISWVLLTSYMVIDCYFICKTYFRNV
eukprot:177276_1